MNPFASHPADAIYRIATFAVPERSLAEFLERAGELQSRLRQQPGLVDVQAFQRPGGPGQTSIVSIAVWQGQAAMEAAAQVVAAADAEAGFDRPAYLARLGITSETAIFAPLAL